MTRLRLRYLASEDLALADSLRALAGWNQTVVDWRRFIDLSPRGCLIAECEGRPVATVVTVAYGVDLGWIGMMLVHPDVRRRGIASVLMGHAIEILRSARVKSIKLDATTEGREVYLRMGFKDEFTLTRFRIEAAAAKASASVRPMTADDLAQVVRLDEGATGARRETLLARLLSESSRAVVFEASGEVTGFGMIRGGSNASYLGPIIAGNPVHAGELAASLTSGSVVCDVPDHNAAAAAWAASNGFTAQRTLTRMYLGENVRPAAPEGYFAIAAPDLG